MSEADLGMVYRFMYSGFLICYLGFVNLEKVDLQGKVVGTVYGDSRFKHR